MKLKLVEFRKRRCLKQRDVAPALGVSGPHLSQLEQGVVPFTLRMALRVEEWSAGAVPALELLDGDDAQLLDRAIGRAVERARMECVS